MVRKTLKTRTRKSKTKKEFEQVNVNTILTCKNQKYGCDVRAKPYICYTHTRYKKNKTKADKITFTRSKKGTRKLKKPVLRIVSWFDCSHFD